MLIALALALQAAPAAPSNSISGNVIYADCAREATEDRDSALRADVICLAWVAGLTGGINNGQTAPNKRTVCFPQGGQNGQYRDIIVAYMTRRPEVRHLPAASLAYVALSEAFPCAKTAP